MRGFFFESTTPIQYINFTALFIYIYKSMRVPNSDREINQFAQLFYFLTTYYRYPKIVLLATPDSTANSLDSQQGFTENKITKNSFNRLQSM